MDRRRALFVALGVVVGLALLAVVVVAAVGGGDDDEVAVDDGTTTTVAADDITTTSDTTSTTAPDAATPRIVAVDGDGRLVVLDDEGDIDRVLLEGIRVDDPASNGIAVAQDRGEVFVTRPGEAGAPTELIRVGLAGAGEETLADGSAPSVSPDGSQLAYVKLVERDGPLPAPALVVRNLDTGEERELARDAEPDFHFIADTAWTADGAQVAFVAGEIFTALYLVDARAGTLDDAERVGPDAREEGSSWSAVTAFGDDTLAVVETCCDVGDRVRWLVLAVNVAQRTVEGGLLPAERTEASRLDSPAGEQRLLYVTDIHPGGGILHRWDGAGAPEIVAEGIVVAAW